MECWLVGGEGLEHTAPRAIPGIGLGRVTAALLGGSTAHTVEGAIGIIDAAHSVQYYTHSCNGLSR